MGPEKCLDFSGVLISTGGGEIVAIINCRYWAKQSICMYVCLCPYIIFVSLTQNVLMILTTLYNNEFAGRVQKS